MVHVVFIACLGSKQRINPDPDPDPPAVRWVGQDLDLLSFKILSYGPCFVGTGIVLEKEDGVLGDGD